VKGGETVLVNAAAGAVGSVVGQIAKLKVSIFLQEIYAGLTVCTGNATVNMVSLLWPQGVYSVVGGSSLEFRDTEVGGIGKTVFPSFLG
jgi:hypothetical protein